MPRRSSSAALFFSLLLVGCAHTNYDPEDSPQHRPVPRGTGTLTVLNDSTTVIYRVRLARVTDGNWGEDRLDGAEVIKPGESRSFEVVSGRYNVHVEFKDGSVSIDDAVYTVNPNDEAVCTVQSDAQAAVGTLTIINKTGYAICRVYFSLTNSMGWGDDRLSGNQVLAPRKRLSWEVPAGKYNLKVEFQDGTSLEGGGAYEVVTGEAAVYELGSQ